VQGIALLNRYDRYVGLIGLGLPVCIEINRVLFLSSHSFLFFRRRLCSHPYITEAVHHSEKKHIFEHMPYPIFHRFDQGLIATGSSSNRTCFSIFRQFRARQFNYGRSAIRQRGNST